MIRRIFGPAQRHRWAAGGTSATASFALAALFAMLYLGGPSVAGAAEIRRAEPIPVVATTGMIADVVRTVGGDRVAVRQLMGEGVDPHLFKATRTDIAAILDARATFYNGLLLEGKMTDVLERLRDAGRMIVAVTQTLPDDALVGAERGRAHADPHVWMDPRVWSRTVAVVRDALIALDPEGAAQFTHSAAAYERQLVSLDAYAERLISAIPQQRRVLVTAHDAFGYLGRRYGLTVEGIQGLSTESEAGLKRIEALVGMLVIRAIPAVFVESTVPDRSVRALIAGAAARGHRVKLGGELFSDAMGAPGTYEGTYIGMIDHNVTVIARALGGAPPEGGFQGRLSVSSLTAKRGAHAQ
ncbi:MAG: metal ABC transporter solute-binding protein, Zn/Mn family [Hyphomicrobiaceae bacterium]